MKLGNLLFAMLFTSTSLCAAPPTGDTEGVASGVKVHNTNNGPESFRIYFSSVTNDRWGCVANDGSIVVRIDGVGVSPESYNQMYSAALTAVVTGNTLALDSAGSSPCINVNMAMVLAN